VGVAVEKDAASDGEVVTGGTDHCCRRASGSSHRAEEKLELARAELDGGGAEAVARDDAVADEQLGRARGLDAAAVVGRNFYAVQGHEAVRLDGSAGGVALQVEAFEEQGGAVEHLDGGGAA